MIRDFRDDDMERVLDIWLRASQQAHAFIDADFWRQRLQDMRDVYLPAAASRVVESDGCISGFYSLHDGALAALFVAPECQGRGLGSHLLSDAKIHLPMLELAVYSANAGAVAFYQRHGFEVLEEREDEHTGHPEKRMGWMARPVACGCS
ncbi:N-acetyltransferase [Pseudomonas nicosulfuronedens]|uniref:N-acetyltransferase n=1 Tax=Pseudomonas nicosulfuronedens TaxID=2571105 RepID=A0A5R9R9B6_9PSED|nr:N-acetyltransferase [Pseudomonas nicosulfuronedens]MDH1010951.1 N-acetyltransferase [Pseudomonas nicosulfuronedens]MDH1979474.1 N-acetyltransferase [Pseudomonas nicosulfuronedens]MDH2026721.1 N-acetyltransferase [Pseudomonas nicosulfuronedens]TLX79624.1 N-acetyltransferase [Pseudomonas nicosulfuronedens]